ncbi:MAG: hypothetical protein WKF89_06725, partial [Chitinophagaceae bacterium]
NRFNGFIKKNAVLFQNRLFKKGSKSLKFNLLSPKHLTTIFHSFALTLKKEIFAQFAETQAQ